MKSLLIFVFTFVYVVNLFAQGITYLEDVPESFKKNYYRQQHEYNPLHVGDLWQYAREDGPIFRNISKDTVINSIIYFKKIDYHIYNLNHQAIYLYTMERNDGILSATYMLDYEDIDNDGIFNEELLLDSLEAPNHTVYSSYRFTWKNGYFPGPYNAHLDDSSWAIIFGDTVMARRIEYLEFFVDEIVADKYGCIEIWNEGSTAILTAAIIDGVVYGKLLDMEDDEARIPENHALFQNYPNPFNPTTTIKYSLPNKGNARLEIYNTLGQLIDVLIDKFHYAGTYMLNWNGGKYSSGVYYYRLLFEGNNKTGKMLLIK
ncbi:MAG: T9SS type A sorting domain-containing protein [bacterium]